MGIPLPTVIHFNSQPHKEADNSFIFILPRSGYFNSQPHKEADGIKMPNVRPLNNFNSQPHKEADDVLHWTLNNKNVFQLTASQGG